MNLRAKEIILILTDLLLGVVMNVSSIISALAYDKGDLNSFLTWLTIGIVSGTGCAGISWWAWWQLKKK